MTRTEPQIFDELADLCRSPGYLHAITFLCYRDAFVAFSGKLTPKDLQPTYARERLVQTEISTLIGLAIKASPDYALPAATTLRRYITRSEKLLAEIHQSMFVAALGEDWTTTAKDGGEDCDRELEEALHEVRPHSSLSYQTPVEFKSKRSSTNPNGAILQQSMVRRNPAGHGALMHELGD